MKKFNELGVKPSLKTFQGDKIGIKKLLNKEISVFDYKIEPSKYPDKGNGKCLYLQIEVGGEKRVLFTGSGVLMDTIEQIPKDQFPFSTTIIEESERYEFR
jgi:hypothetical protein